MDIIFNFINIINYILQYMKQFIILFFCASIIFAQNTENNLFSSNDILETKISFSPKKLRKSNNDTLYFDTPLMYKVGEDIRQNQLTLKILTVMNSIWLKNQLDLHMTCYACMSTGSKSGMVQMVDD